MSFSKCYLAKQLMVDWRPKTSLPSQSLRCYMAGCLHSRKVLVYRESKYNRNEKEEKKATAKSR